MNKILRGVIQFRNTVRKDLVKQFEDVKNNPAVSFFFEFYENLAAVF